MRLLLRCFKLLLLLSSFRALLLLLLISKIKNFRVGSWIFLIALSQNDFELASCFRSSETLVANLVRLYGCSSSSSSSPDGSSQKQMLNPKQRTSYLEELLARMVDPTHDSAKKPEVDEPGAYSHGAERRDHEVTFTISAVKPLGVVERYGLQERAARRVLVRTWADVLLRRVARQERQLLGLRGVHRTALGPVQPGDHAEAVADWGFPNPNPNPSAFASSAAVPRGVACWRTARGLRQAALFAAKRARVDWRAVRREVTAKSWLGDPALPPAAVAAASLSGGAAQAATASAAWAVEEAGAETGPGTASAVAGTAVGMPRAALNKLVGCSARELQRQVEAVRRHVKAKPFCDESRELWGLLNEARRLEDEVRRLDKQLLLACHALELHFSQRPDPFDEAAGVGEEEEEEEEEVVASSSPVGRRRRRRRRRLYRLR